MERALQGQRSRLGDEDPKQLVKNLNGLRRVAYNDLVYSIKIANKYLFLTFGDAIPMGGVYSGDRAHLTGTFWLEFAIFIILD